MKKLFLVAAALMCFGFAGAQNIKYQGEASLGFGAGVGTYNMNRVPIHTVHGVRLNDNFFVGGGLGVDIFSKDGESATIIPVFANAKGYLPVSDKVSLLAALDLGYGIGTGDFSKVGGLYAYPQIGCNLKIMHKYSFDFTFGYNSQSLSNDGVSINLGAIGFKIAFVW